MILKTNFFQRLLLCYSILIFFIMPSVSKAEENAPVTGVISSSTVSNEPLMAASSSSSGGAQPMLNTGAASATVPISMPAVRGKNNPLFSINYNSDVGNGLLGAGWDVPLTYIELENRAITTGREYVVSINGDRKKLVEFENNMFRMEVEDSYMLFEYKDVSKTEGYFVARDGAGNDFVFDTRQSPNRFFSEYDEYITRWYLTSQSDSNLNKIKYFYKKSFPQHCLSDSYQSNTFSADYILDKISYNNFQNGSYESYVVEVNMVYECRPDYVIKGGGGLVRILAERLSNIHVRMLDGTGYMNLIRSYDFTYEQASSTNRSLLAKVQVKGVDGSSDLPPTTYAYSDDVEFGGADSYPPNVKEVVFPNLNDSSDELGSDSVNFDWKGQLADWNRDGFIDIVRRGESGVLQVLFNKETHFSLKEYGGLNLWWKSLNDINKDGFLDVVGYRLGENNNTEYKNPDGALLGPINAWYSLDKVDVDSDWFSHTFKEKTKLIDFNGDGKIEAYLPKKEEVRFYNNFPQSDNYLTKSISSDYVNEVLSGGNSDIDCNSNGDASQFVSKMAFDVNGDGLPDLLDNQSGRIKVRFNRGVPAGWLHNSADFNFEDMFSSPVTWQTYMNFPFHGMSLDCQTGLMHVGAALVDINSDGLPDWLINYKLNGLNQFNVLFNTGSGFNGPYYFDIYVNGNYKKYKSVLPNSISSNYWTGFVDIDGDGLIEFKNVSRKYHNLYKEKPALLRKIDNGIGGKTVIHYKPSTFYYTGDAQSKMPIVKQVVSKMEHIDLVSNINTSSHYIYRDAHISPKFDKDGKEYSSGFMGFENVYSVASDYMVTHTQFHTDHKHNSEIIGRMKSVTNYSRFTPTKDFTAWNKKAVIQVLQHAVEENEISKTTNDWRIKEVGDVKKPYILSTISCEFRNESKCSAAVTKINDYGAPLEIERRTLTGNSINEYDPALSTKTRTQYVSDSRSYNSREFHFLPSKVELYTLEGSPRKISEVKNYYDMYTSSSQSGMAFKGMLTKQTRNLFEVPWIDVSQMPNRRYGNKGPAVSSGVKTVKTMEYDSYGNLTKNKDASGRAVCFSYDNYHHLYVVEENKACGARFGSNADFITTFEYDWEYGGQLKIQTGINGISKEYGYDEYGRLIDVWHVASDGSKRLAKHMEFYFDGARADYERGYNQVVEKLYIDDENGTRSSYDQPYIEKITYSDAFGRTHQVKTHLGDDYLDSNRYMASDTKIYSELTGKALTEIAPYETVGSSINIPTSGYGSSYYFNDRNELEKTVAAEFNSSDRIEQGVRIDSRFRKAKVASNYITFENNRTISTTTDANGNSKHSVEYGGRLLKTMDAEGFETQYSYDIAGNAVMTKQESEDKIVVTKALYDSFGRKVHMEDQDNGRYAYVYDSIGNLTSEIHLGSSSNYNTKVNRSYNDPLSRLTEKKVRKTKRYKKSNCSTSSWYYWGSSTCYYYREVTEPGTVITYKYDSDENAVGKLISITDDNGVIRLRYDKYGNKYRTEKKFENNGHVIGSYFVEKTFDRTGRLEEANYNDEKQIKYNYLESGRLKRVEDELDKSYLDVLSFNSSGQGQPRYIKYGNGVRSLNFYNKDGSLKRKAAYVYNSGYTYYQDYRYYRDNVGNLTRMYDYSHYPSDSRQNYRITYNYNYDSRYRLTSADSYTYFRPGESSGTNEDTVFDIDMNYEYDNFGNIKSKTGMLGNNHVSDYYIYYDKTPHRLASADGGETSMRYDTKGNIVDSGNGQRYYYDDYNRLESIYDLKSRKTTFKFLYDSTGSRYGVGEFTDSGWKWRYYFGELMEIDEEGNVDLIHVQAGGRRIASIKMPSNNTVYYHVDHLGSTRVITNDAGEMVQEFYYSPFGSVIKDIVYDFNNPVINETGNDILPAERSFTGQKLDNSGLMYYKARYYNPQLGRFIQADSLVPNPLNSQDYNKYSYVYNNPLNYTDPSGNEPFLIAGAIIGAGIGAYTGYKIAESRGYGWDDWETYGYVFGGALIGGGVGFAGGYIATSGMPMAYTFATLWGSGAYTGLMSAMSNNQTDVSLSIGFASYNVSQRAVGYLGKSGNSWQENVGYTLGTLAVLSDLLNINPKWGDDVELVTENSDFIGHSELALDKDPVISWGPTEQSESLLEYLVNVNKGTNEYHSYYKDLDATFPHLNVRANKYIIKFYAKFLDSTDLPYNAVFSACSTHTSIALNLSGAFNMGFLHPFILHYQMMLNPFIFSTSYYWY